MMLKNSLSSFSSTHSTAGQSLFSWCACFSFISTLVMSSSTKITRLIPFAAQWILEENDLKDLQDSKNGRLHSTYVSTDGVEYCLQIYPNGSRKKTRGKCMLFLGVKMRGLKEIEAKYTVLVESAECSQDFTHTFVETRGWGKSICETAELFDPEKRFIVDGKMILKVYGMFEVNCDKKENKCWCRCMCMCGIAAELGNKLWENEESKDLKLIVDGKELKVHKLVLATVSPVFAEMFKTKESIDQIEILDFDFKMVEKNLKQIYQWNGELKNVDVVSGLRFSEKYKIQFLKDRYSNTILQQCGKVALKGDEITKIENNGKKYIYNQKISNLADKLWESDDYKDFKIIVEGKEFKVHKLILALKSPKFAKMFKTKEGTDQIEIPDFTHNLVEIALKMIYECISIPMTTIDDKKALFQFFEEYKFLSLKNALETFFIGRLTAANVCLYANFSIASNAAKLKEKCIEFLTDAVELKTPISDIKTLDKEIASKVLENSLYNTVETYPEKQ